ncbi:unnamed protein product [Clavelina lepadiformis]|uniref:Thiopurine S-methyltransferase n=1 Tax=Clavelina lepadiformis TaxID=159417 RepID=A0ABP0F2A8_CLALP
MSNMQSATEDVVMKEGDWLGRWNNRKIAFHNLYVHPDLMKHERKFLKANDKVYVPLCGKSFDLNYLASEGYDVIGCEFSETAIIEFFDEHSIKYERSHHPTAPYEIFKGLNKKITIYKGDFFGLDSAIMGKVDAVWDRGSFVAIHPSQQTKYVVLMHDVVNPTGKYLLVTFFYQGSSSGPPYSITGKAIHDVFSRYFNISVVETYRNEELGFLKRASIPYAGVTEGNDPITFSFIMCSHVTVKYNHEDTLNEEYWKKIWENGQIHDFHHANVHEHLIKYKDHFLHQNCRVFIPLCGKSVDLNYLAECGHEVVGCELSETAILQFFQEHSMTFKQSQYPKAPFEVFKAADKNITIYKGDFLKLNSSVIGKFDAVWDQGAFIAIHPSQRLKYTDIMKDLISLDGKYLLFSLQFDGVNSATPYSVTEMDMEETFGRYFDVSTLETYQKTESAFLKRDALSSAIVFVSLLKLK